MAWTKQPKLVGSCGIGYQTFNRFKESLETLRDDYLVEHASGETPQIPVGQLPKMHAYDLTSGIGVARPNSPGRHYSPKIAVGIANVRFDNVVDTTTPTFRWTSSGIYMAVNRISTGIYFISSRWLDSIIGRVTVRQATNTYAITTMCLPLINSTLGTSPVGLCVWVYSNASGSMALTDGIGFDVVAFFRTPIDLVGEPAGEEVPPQWYPTYPDQFRRPRPAAPYTLAYVKKANP